MLPPRGLRQNVIHHEMPDLSTGHAFRAGCPVQNTGIAGRGGLYKAHLREFAPASRNKTYRWDRPGRQQWQPPRQVVALARGWCGCRLVSAVLGVGWCLGWAVLLPHAFCIIASRLHLQHVVLPAACRRLHKPAADIQVVEKHRTQSNRSPKIWQACNPCTGIATVKFHVGYFIVPVRAFSASMPP